MTKEMAIDILRGVVLGTNEQTHEAVFMAIKALKEQARADAVPVVRCKDCKYYLNSNEKCGLIDTRLHFYETDKTWTEDCFCSMRDGFIQTAWDYCCIDYGGLAKEENLLVTSKKPPRKANKKKEAE